MQDVLDSGLKKSIFLMRRTCTRRAAITCFLYNPYFRMLWDHRLALPHLRQQCEGIILLSVGLSSTMKEHHSNHHYDPQPTKS